MLLLCWLVLGWVVPALLLLPNTEEGRRQQQREARRREAAGPPCGSRERALAVVESGLRLLLPQQSAGQSDTPTSLLCALRWWVLVQLLWGMCCKAAPLFTPASSYHG